jgi:hypothetical protein
VSVTPAARSTALPGAQIPPPDRAVDPPNDPPPALLTGVLVDRAGERVCDESRYGTALGDAIIRHAGQAWLLVERPTRAQARRQVRGSAAAAPVRAAPVSGRG